MLRLILRDLRNMLRRPVVSLLLLIGLIVGGFAMVVYFVSSSQELKIQRYISGEENTVEAPMRVSQDVQFFYDAVVGGELPEIRYAAVLSYKNPDYDIIGIYWDVEGVEAMESGAFIDRTMMGQMVAVAQPDLIDGQTLAVGDSIRVAGRAFEVVGLMPAEAGYAPYAYDMRRLPQGSEHVAGTELEEIDAQLRQRPLRALIIPMDVFAELGLEPDYCHISFMEDISGVREQVEASLLEQAGISKFTDMTQFMEVSRVNQISRALLYAAAVLAGLINIVSLYAFFLRENRRQYLTYKMLGATGGKIAAILLAELAVYTLAAFAISCAGALPFIDHSGLILRYMPFRAVDFILLFAALYCFAALASLGQVRALAGRSVRSGRADAGPDRDRAAQTKDEPGAGKGLYLLSFLYRKNIWRTVSIVFLSLATAFTLAYAMTYVYDAGKMERYINRMFPNDMFSVHLNNSTVSTINTDAFERQINPLEHPLNQELEARLAQLGVPVGRLRFRMLTKKDTVDENSEQFLYVCQADRGFAEAEPILLSKGSWAPLAQYDKTDEQGVIPCIIPPYMEEILPLGSQFEYEVCLNLGTADLGVDEQGMPVGTSIADWHKRTFEVVGVIAENAYNIMGYSQANDYFSSGYGDITNVLEPLSDRSGQSGSGLHTPGYIPDILHNGKSHFDATSTPCYYLFPQAEADITAADINAALTGLGGVQSARRLTDMYMQNYKSGGGSISFMHAAVAAVLLALGVGGYGIILFAANRRTFGVYYVCGMPWGKAAGLTVAGNALSMLLPALFGAVAGVYVAQGVRAFDGTTIALSILTGAGAVLAVYAITSAVIALSMRRARPRQLMTESGQP